LVGMFTEFIRLTWPEDNQINEKLTSIIQTLRIESDSEGDERREKQKWDNYIPAADKRPLDEFYDVDTIESQCVEPPVDISQEKDESMIKYVVKTNTS